MMTAWSCDLSNWRFRSDVKKKQETVKNKINKNKNKKIKIKFEIEIELKTENY